MPNPKQPVYGERALQMQLGYALLESPLDKKTVCRKDPLEDANQNEAKEKEKETKEKEAKEKEIKEPAEKTVDHVTPAKPCCGSCGAAQLGRRRPSWKPRWKVSSTRRIQPIVTFLKQL